MSESATVIAAAAATCLSIFIRVSLASLASVSPSSAVVTLAVATAIVI